MSPHPQLGVGCSRSPQRHLFEGVQDLLPLAEVLEEELQGAGDERGVVVHGQVDQHPQEHPPSLVVHLQHAARLPAAGWKCWVSTQS